MAGRWLRSPARRDAEVRRRAVDDALARPGPSGEPGDPGGQAGLRTFA